MGNETPERATDERILEAATELFGARGFARTSIRQIADRARANSALIYYYFGSKTGLLDALITRMQEAVHANLEASVATAGTPPEKLERFIRLQIGLLRQRSPLLRILIRELLNQDEAAAATMRRALAPNLAMLSALLEEGVASGDFRRVDPQLAARTLVGSLLVPVVLAPIVLGEDDADRRARLPDHIVDLYLRGILA
jgi:AcrR family transcriptional regulator